MTEEPAAVEQLPAAPVPAPPGTMRIELPGRALISLEGQVEPAMIRAVLKGLGV